MRLGLHLLKWTITLFLLTSLGMIGLSILGTVVIPDAARGTRVALALLLFVQVIGGLLGLVSIGLICTIPREAGAGGYVLGFLVCLLGTFVLLVGMFLLILRGPRSMPEVGVPLAPLLMLLAAVSVFVGNLCFTMIFRAAARFWGDRKLGGRFVTYFIVSWVAALVCGVVFVAIGVAPSSEVSLLLGVLGACGLLIYSLAMMLWLLSLLGRLRQRISLAGPAEPYRAGEIPAQEVNL